jgi:hypothetical protein
MIYIYIYNFYSYVYIIHTHTHTHTHTHIHACIHQNQTNTPLMSTMPSIMHVFKYKIVYHKNDIYTHYMMCEYNTHKKKKHQRSGPSGRLPFHARHIWRVSVHLTALRTPPRYLCKRSVRNCLSRALVEP